MTPIENESSDKSEHSTGIGAVLPAQFIDASINRAFEITCSIA